MPLNVTRAASYPKSLGTITGPRCSRLRSANEDFSRTAIWGAKHRTSVQATGNQRGRLAIRAGDRLRHSPERAAVVAALAEQLARSREPRVVTVNHRRKARDLPRNQPAAVVDGLDDIALEYGRVVPLRLVERRGHDVLRHVVEPVGELAFP